MFEDHEEIGSRVSLNLIAVFVYYSHLPSSSLAKASSAEVKVTSLVRRLGFVGRRQAARMSGYE